MDVVSIGETMVLFSPNQNGQLRYAKDFTSRIAGAETNTLIGLAKLGYQTGWISKVGEDELGKRIINSVRGEGVDTSFVQEYANAATGLFLKEQTTANNARVIYYRNNSAASQMTPADIEEDYLAKAKILYITGITPALSSSCRETIFYAVDLARRNGLKIVFDPNIRKTLLDEKNGKEMLKELIAKSDIVLPGISEGEYLFETKDCQEIAQKCKRLGAKAAIVKLGENGAYYSTANKSGFAEPFAVEKVIDPIGAGDGFAAGVLSGILDNLSIYESARRGCAIGSMVTLVNGDIEGLPDKKLLQEYMSSTVKEDVIR
ncbi:sugar kinase [Niallia sp. NCCP-28]|uniref:sugar kinase n=1 Tax=Niallia sp. NCCP-28 TaxID=2934712 RepID=UPI0020821FA2|nr:sugar kinase [Niallia sp. NCCP-28]GKU81980.1 2-dehydro-3-deoxygluconokinase [Niallia sp. NCCP-28]